jgi:L-asparaginase
MSSDDGDEDVRGVTDHVSDPSDDRPTVRVLSCGGTIASEPDEDGAAPAKSGADLVAAVPQLGEYAAVEAVEVASHPGFDMRFEAVADVARAVETSDADGYVVTHGTDTLADTAYALWLTLDPDVPVVVTGAQRRFDEPSSDAPANLTTAVRAATGEAVASGVFVAFDDELHAAPEVVKTHTNKLDTFRSPGTGPVATFSRGGVTVQRPCPPTGALLPTEGLAATADVAVVHSGLGVGADTLERALAAGVDGVVVEGTGLGNVTGALGDAIGEAVASVPVVVASRCHAGPTEAVYGTPGGAVTLRRHGVTFAGDLPASKARVALVVALTAEVSTERRRSAFG